MLFALDICVNKKAPPTHSVHWGLNLTSKLSTSSYLSSLLLNLQTIQTPLFRQFTPTISVFHAPPKNRIFQ